MDETRVSVRVRFLSTMARNTTYAMVWGAILNGNENSVLKHYSYNRGLFNLLVGSSNDIFLAIGLLNPGQDDRIHDL